MRRLVRDVHKISCYGKNHKANHKCLPQSDVGSSIKCEGGNYSKPKENGNNDPFYLLEHREHVIEGNDIENTKSKDCPKPCKVELQEEEKTNDADQCP
ncbi:MAG: hypothetical protein QS99_C0007G0034 [archaeon GW2011_AR4]|nr:MAG: hypothetical protein QS99_C0007G0034 [archaeon GW2011_AR4]